MPIKKGEKRAKKSNKNIRRPLSRMDFILVFLIDIHSASNKYLKFSTIDVVVSPQSMVNYLRNDFDKLIKNSPRKSQRIKLNFRFYLDVE